MIQEAKVLSMGKNKMTHGCQGAKQCSSSSICWYLPSFWTAYRHIFKMLFQKRKETAGICSSALAVKNRHCLQVIQKMSQMWNFLNWKIDWLFYNIAFIKHPDRETPDFEYHAGVAEVFSKNILFSSIFQINWVINVILPDLWCKMEKKI